MYHIIFINHSLKLVTNNIMENNTLGQQLFPTFFNTNIRVYLVLHCTNPKFSASNLTFIILYCLIHFKTWYIQTYFYITNCSLLTYFHLFRIACLRSEIVFFSQNSIHCGNCVYRPSRVWQSVKQFLSNHKIYFNFCIPAL